MSKYDKLFIQILSGTQDNNISFGDLQKALTLLGFVVRIKGDHFIYTRENVEEIINIQPNGNKAKPYQVKQVRNIILKYKMGGNLNA
ncbi:MAG: type II toxin-antitoxin system HicA family toxin [Huintestinicola sp.]|uniref:type II toxin-antitoxin system HicA family toxin n=1 Tax=Huintestinicola sp. TaxID=2981661 RepID=UPI003F120651